MRAVDLFAGCGGLTCGFEKAGIDVVAAFEKWSVAAQCHRENFNHPVFEEDLSDVEHAVEIIRGFKPDIVIGGPPCQDFSNAGKRVEADRADLTRCFAEIVSMVHPMCFVMENVALAKSSNAYANAREIFKSAGYGLTEIVLDASLCGVPQRRKRFICFGMSGMEDGFAMDLFTSRLAQKPMTVRDYVGDSFGLDFYYRHPRTYGSRAIYSIDEPSATIRGVNCEVPGTYKEHPHPKDAAPVTPDLRALTYKERAMIQTFPDDFKWIGKKAEIEQMIGNAVPVNLGYYIAETVQMAIRNRNKTYFQGFRTWLENDRGYSRIIGRDYLSRMKRADLILPWTENETYIEDLEQRMVKNGITQMTRTGIRRSVRIFNEYINTLRRTGKEISA